MSKDYEKAANSHLSGNMRSGVSQNQVSALQGIGYALLYIGDQLERLADAQEMQAGVRPPSGVRSNKPGEDIETKG